MIRNHIARLLASGMTVMSLTACHGIFNDIYDDAPADTDFSEGYHPGLRADHCVLMLDATNYQEWIYLNLNDLTIERRDIPTPIYSELQTTDNINGDSHNPGVSYYLVEGTKYTLLSYQPSPPQTDPEHWDIAIHHFDVRTNGGCVAQVAESDIFKAADIDFLNLDYTADEPTTHQVIVDLKEMMGFKIGFQNIPVNMVFTTWATMDFSTPPPTYATSGDTYFLRTADGRHFAIRMRDYISPRGTKGYLTIDLIKL